MTLHQNAKAHAKAVRRPIVSDGISQHQRILPALRDGYFNVDEMRLPDLLALIGKYAGGVKFRNAENRDDGEWDTYFSSDETMVIAAILATDLAGYAAAFEQLWDDVGGNPQRLVRDIAIEELPSCRLATLIDGWYVALKPAQTQVGRDLHGLLASIVVRLQDEFAHLQAFCGRMGEARESHARFAATLDPVWLGDAPVPAIATEAATEAKAGGAERTAGSGPARQFSFKTNFYAFLKAVDMVQKGAARLLPASLSSQSHDPSIGLLIAFAQLYQRLQGRLNRFTHRHLDFYYDKVLLARPQPARADKTCIVLQASLPGREIVIPQRTEFSAGMDVDKREIVFASDTPLLVSNLQVCALHTLYFDRDPNSTPENGLHEPYGREQSRQYATGGYVNRIEQKPGEVIVDAAKLEPQPLLGAPKIARDAMFMPDARLGFAIASQVLALREGKRRVRFTLTFEPGAEGEDLFAQRVASLAEAVNGRQQDATQQQMAIEDAFFRVFRRMFSIAVTCEHGWQEVTEYIPLYKGVERNFDIVCDAHTLVIDFELPPDVPAVTPYVAAVHGERYATSLPVARFVLHADYMYPYGLLDRLKMRKIAIDVRVEGCKALTLFNNVGQLTPAAPFQPFGPLPAPGSYFIIGSAEAASKRLTSFDIDINWGGLPAGYGGFRDWYAGYEYKEGAAVSAAASVLVDGKWTPGDFRKQPPVTLFDRWDDERDLQTIRAQRKLSFDQVIHHFKPAGDVRAGAELSYTPTTRNGFFKLTLVEPEFAFGHKEYPLALAHALTYNATEKNVKRHKPLPNLPYTPQINAISLNYTAFTHLDLAHVNARSGSGNDTSDRMFHLHPLGWEAIDGRRHDHNTLVPHYEDSGSLYIGLDGEANGQIVNLLFHLHPDSLPCESPTGPVLRWSYLVDNRWIDFRNRVVADTTRGFMVSGIVSLEMPPDIDRDNTVLPAGTLWIRVTAEADLDKVCSLYGVYANGLQISRMHGDAYSTSDAALPVAAIQRSRKTIPGLGKIVQPIASFGGAPAETREQLRTRISGRLRHKNRAVSPGDYQTLILEKFPEIHKVKCFPNMRMDADPQRWIAPGRILLVALPQLSPSVGANHMPTLDGHLIGEVKEYISSLASPWAEIDVRNPVYEHLQVRCTVKFKAGFGGGYYVKLLNQAISQFLSPWGGGGYSVHFGWRVRQHDVESFILGLDYVEFVTAFSMLRITPDGGDRFGLLDTATRLEGGLRRKDIAPNYPWSIAVPLERHAIEVNNNIQSIDPKAAGLSALEVGTTFIIGTEG